MGPAAFIASILLTRPIGAQGAEGFGLAESSKLRPWIPVVNVLWIPYSLLMLTAIFAPTATQNPTMRSPQDQWMGAASFVGVIAQTAWVVLLFHMGNIADYLRDAFLRRIATTWCWIWGVFVFIVLPFSVIKAARSQARAAIAQPVGKQTCCIFGVERIGHHRGAHAQGSQKAQCPHETFHGDTSWSMRTST